MRLGELLTQITPQPWVVVSAADGDKWIGTNRGDDRITTLDGNTLPIDHTYLVHAANVLPEAVEALKLLLEDQGKAKSELSRGQFDFCESALTKAQTIELKGESL